MTKKSTQFGNGRDCNGRFAGGNSIGKRGRPRREIETAYLSAFCDGVPEDQLQRIVAAIAAKAEAGSVAAARLLLTHAMPSQELRIELASTDAEFRVAGLSPRENMEKMQQHIADRVAEMRAAEHERKS